jgi:hypothetical protein
MEVDVYERITSAFVQLLLWQDSINIMSIWCQFGPSSDLNVINSIKTLLDIFSFRPFHFSINKFYIQLFRDAPMLRISIDSLCKGTQYCVSKFKTINKKTPVFFRTEIHSTVTTTFDDFKYDHVIDRLLERRLVIYFFFWVLFQFDTVKGTSAAAHNGRIAIAKLLWIACEGFLVEHTKRWPRPDVLDALDELQLALAQYDITSIYDILKRRLFSHNHVI